MITEVFIPNETVEMWKLKVGDEFTITEIKSAGIFTGTYRVTLRKKPHGP